MGGVKYSKVFQSIPKYYATMLLICGRCESHTGGVGLAPPIWSPMPPDAYTRDKPHTSANTPRLNITFRVGTHLIPNMILHLRVMKCHNLQHPQTGGKRVLSSPESNVLSIIV